jgi:hypothetical protein
VKSRSKFLFLAALLALGLFCNAGGLLLVRSATVDFPWAMTIFQTGNTPGGQAGNPSHDQGTTTSSDTGKKGHRSSKERHKGGKKAKKGSNANIPGGQGGNPSK